MSRVRSRSSSIFFFQAEDGIRDGTVTGVQTCALPIYQAADELSLDHVFRASTPAKGGGAVGAFSLDQFFAGEMPDAETSANSSEGSGPGRSEERRVGKERRGRRALGQEKTGEWLSGGR